MDTTAQQQGQAAVGSTWTTQVGELPVGQRECQRMPRFGLPQFTSKRIAVPDHPSITVGGAVAQPCTITLADLAGLRRRAQVSDFHCVTTWTKRGVHWSGFRLRDVYDALIVPRARPGAGDVARYLVVSGLDGMGASLPLADALADDVLLADTMDGAPLPAQHGAPLRLVAPAHYGYKSIKHVSAIDIVGSDFNQGFTGFAQHARGRVAHEERGRWGPGWLLRYVYRLTVPAGVWLARVEPDQRQPPCGG
jgi:DMSO/TMAO reductase YedYZ molybdopterin-dependent catalytic subunit